MKRYGKYIQTLNTSIMGKVSSGGIGSISTEWSLLSDHRSTPKPPRLDDPLVFLFLLLFSFVVEIDVKTLKRWFQPTNGTLSLVQIHNTSGKENSPVPQFWNRFYASFGLKKLWLLLKIQMSLLPHMSYPNKDRHMWIWPCVLPYRGQWLPTFGSFN